MQKHSTVLIFFATIYLLIITVYSWYTKKG